jgi:hypothetical protein
MPFGIVNRFRAKGLTARVAIAEKSRQYPCPTRPRPRIVRISHGEMAVVIGAPRPIS